MYRLYDYLPSGNGYKVRLLLAYLDLPYELILLDLGKGETRTEEYLARNPNGKIPLLEVSGRGHLAESNAILTYLADGTPYLPLDTWTRAKVFEWLFFEQYEHEPNIAVLRSWLTKDSEPTEEQRVLFEPKRRRGYEALAIMERRLQAEPYLVGGSPTIADVALYAYTHAAHEGGFDLTDHPGIRRWLDRIAADPKHILITHRR